MLDNTIQFRTSSSLRSLVIIGIVSVKVVYEYVMYRAGKNIWFVPLAEPHQIYVDSGRSDCISHLVPSDLSCGVVRGIAEQTNNSDNSDSTVTPSAADARMADL